MRIFLRKRVQHFYKGTAKGLNDAVQIAGWGISTASGPQNGLRQIKIGE